MDTLQISKPLFWWLSCSSVWTIVISALRVITPSLVISLGK